MKFLIILFLFILYTNTFSSDSTFQLIYSNQYHCDMFHRDDTLFVSSTAGIVKINIETKEVSYIQPKLSDPKYHLDNQLNNQLFHLEPGFGDTIFATNQCYAYPKYPILDYQKYLMQYDGLTWSPTKDKYNSRFYCIDIIHNDGFGNIWFSNDRGIVKFNGTTWEDINYPIKGENNIDLNHICSGPDSTIWFSTRRGLYGY